MVLQELNQKLDAAIKALQELADLLRTLVPKDDPRY